MNNPTKANPTTPVTPIIPTFSAPPLKSVGLGTVFPAPVDEAPEPEAEPVAVVVALEEFVALVLERTPPAIAAGELVEFVLAAAAWYVARVALLL